MLIAEIYQSRQGEGLLTGTPSVFVRTSGCNLRCWFCDTPFTSWSPEGEDLALDEIVARIEAAAHEIAAEPPARHAVLTGGEPLLFAELVPLSERLRASGWHITVETAGTLFLPVACDLMSISPKLASSTPSPERDARWHIRHERSRHAPEVIHKLSTQYEYQFKFVIDQRGDLEEVERYLDEFPSLDFERLYLMPQGTTPEELAERNAWLEPYCRERGYRYCARKQIEWYGFTRGT